MFTGAWRRSQKLERRVVARVGSNGGQNLRFCRPVDEEADKTAHVTKEDLPVRILMWWVGDIPELTASAWGHVARFWLIGFLGFPRRRPRSMSVGSVSTGEGLMCTYLIGRGTDYLVVGFWHSTEPWWLRNAMESRSSRQTCVTSDSDVHMRIFFAC